MKVVILAGGLGARLREETEYKPKPMISIGSMPILWHIMKIYSSYNYKDFVICGGYKNEMIKSFFHNFESNISHLNITEEDYKTDENKNDIDELSWKITVSDTGTSTMTGGRIFKIKKYLDNETFMCTYGDGVADVNLQDLLAFHRKHGKIATVTSVQPPSRFGILNFNKDGLVTNFEEKPKNKDWINGGFFVFEPEIFEYLNEDSVLEHEPLFNLASQGQLVAYRHEGFWQPMDTYRETLLLNEMWSKGDAPWKIWR
jgi:glucose-1-phosphate cytidylyltransferase